MKVTGNNLFVSRKAQFPDWYTFKHPFILNTRTINRFTAFFANDSFDGKFVFDSASKRLALCIGEDKTHEQILTLIRRNSTRKLGVVAAYINFEIREGTPLFTLSGSSGHFGVPTTEEFTEVASYIKKISPRSEVVFS